MEILSAGGACHLSVTLHELELIVGVPARPGKPMRLKLDSGEIGPGPQELFGLTLNLYLFPLVTLTFCPVEAEVFMALNSPFAFGVSIARYKVY